MLRIEWPADLHQRAKAAATAQGVTLGQFVALALTQYLTGNQRSPVPDRQRRSRVKPQAPSVDKVTTETDPPRKATPVRPIEPAPNFDICVRCVHKRSTHCVKGVACGYGTCNCSRFVEIK